MVRIIQQSKTSYRYQFQSYITAIVYWHIYKMLGILLNDISLCKYIEPTITSFPVTWISLQVIGFNLFVTQVSVYEYINRL